LLEWLDGKVEYSIKQFNCSAIQSSLVNRVLGVYSGVRAEALTSFFVLLLQRITRRVNERRFHYYFPTCLAGVLTPTPFGRSRYSALLSGEASTPILGNEATPL